MPGANVKDGKNPDRWRMLEHLFDAVALIDKSRMLIFVNDQFRKLAQIDPASPVLQINATDCLELPVSCWDSMQDAEINVAPRVHSVPFSFRGGTNGFAQVFIDRVPTQNPSEEIYMCVVRDFTFEVQSRTRMDENEILILELRRRHAEAQFLWRLSTETPMYIDPTALLVTVAKKLKEELGFEEACFLQIPDGPDAQPEPLASDQRLGSRLRVVANSLVPLLKKKTGRIEIFSENFDSYGTFWITNFRPKLDKPFFLLARSEQSSRDTNRRPLLEPLATQITGWLDNRSVYLSSITDSLTGLFNRRHFDSRFTVECLLARERQVILTLIVIDIDHFKKVNDSFGHQIGDHVLKETAKIVKSALRTSDITARIGGEEFAALLVDTSPEDALVAAEKIRIAVADKPMALPGLGKSIEITVSIGIAGYMGLQQDTPEAVFGAADQALYKAKASGRNCIVVGGEQVPSIGATEE